MDDLISRRKAIDALCKAGCGSGHCGISCDDVKAIEALPSAQPEIIYCKDCVHHIDGFFCEQANHHTSDKDHCASVFRAERREE